MRPLFWIIVASASLGGCYRAPAREPVQMSLWADEENHKIALLENRVSQLEAESKRQEARTAGLEVSQRPAPGAGALH